jgi:hypothetical protein
MDQQLTALLQELHRFGAALAPTGAGALLIVREPAAT